MLPPPHFNLGQQIGKQKPPVVEETFERLQGNILKGHGRDHTTHIFFAFKAAVSQRVARKFLKTVTLGYVTSMATQIEETKRFKTTGKSGDLFCNLFLTAKGYARLGIAPADVASVFPIQTAEFAPGAAAFTLDTSKSMSDAASVTLLNDPTPTGWEDGYGDGAIEAMILLGDDNEARLHSMAKTLLTAIESLGEVLVVEFGHVVRNADGQGIEHFGYADGVSQPLYLPEDIAAERLHKGDDTWSSEELPKLTLIPDPLAGKPNSFGSYFVFRKLEQNVKGFNAAEEKLADDLGLTGEDAERAGALIVGRFEDGTPVTLSPFATGNISIPNDFDFADDMVPSRCPFFAHIRKVNPRGDTKRLLGGTDEFERSHRLTRRGIPFGKRNVEPAEGVLISEMPTGCVGLIFMCFQSNLAHQFAFMQSQWANNSAFVAPDTGVDPIIGQASAAGDRSYDFPAEYDQPAAAPTLPGDFADFVKMRGGEYFFCPSITFLRGL